MSERYHLLDALRGISIILMVFYHFGYDLVAAGYLPVYALYNPILEFLQPMFAGIFIFLCGASSRFSHSNARRGLMLGALAVVITIITWFAGATILFGILHFLAVAILLYGLLAPLLGSVDSIKAMVLYAAFFTLTYALYPQSTDISGLWMLGLVSPDFVTSDYFPLAPWFFCFLLGVWFGGHVIAHRLPSWFYSFDMPVLPFVGRNTLMVYLAHQVVLMGMMYLIGILGVPANF